MGDRGAQVAMPSAVRTQLRSKLRKAETTMDSIQGITKAVLKTCEFAIDFVKLWRKELDEAPAKRVLSLLYVANDIMQTCKRAPGGRIFLKEFVRVMGSALKSAALVVGSTSIPKVRRLLDVWLQRKIVNAKDIEAWRELLRHPVSIQSSSKEVSAAGSGGTRYPAGQDAGTPPGSPPPEAYAAAERRLAARRAQKIYGDVDEDDEEPLDDTGAERGNVDQQSQRTSRKRSRASISSQDLGSTVGSASALFSSPKKLRRRLRTDAIDRLSDAASYDYVANELLRKLRKRFLRVDASRLSGYLLLSEIRSGASSTARVKDELIAAASLIKQYKHELQSASERDHQLIMQLKEEYAAQERAIEKLEKKLADVQSTKDDLQSLCGDDLSKMLTLWRPKKRVVKAISTGLSVQSLSDEEMSEDENDGDLDGGRPTNNDDEDGGDEDKVPMMWSRELRTYVPINSSGNDAFWRSDA